MASTSEATFGARLRNAQDLVKVLAKVSNYTAARPEESVAEMTALCNNIVAMNSTVTTALQAYNTGTKTRTGLFRTDTYSLTKLLSPIRKYVAALYGKDSIEENQVMKIITRIRNSKITTVAATTTTTEYTISQSEKSYGSLTQAFTDLVDTLKTFQNYAPAIPHLQIANLDALLAMVTTTNDTVIDALTTLRISRKQRIDLYDDLHNRAQRIKNIIAASYGNSSQEYKLVKSLKI